METTFLYIWLQKLQSVFSRLSYGVIAPQAIKSCIKPQKLNVSSNSYMYALFLEGNANVDYKNDIN